jgi:pimeloyl-ACP methyl ester carboxylesterase
MPRIDVNGIGIAYEIVGDGARSAAITPGGRFSKDTPGVRELAGKLAEGGFRTVIWDRPNCGESDISFAGETESVINADALAGLLAKLNMGPTLLVGGSAGSRVSLITAFRHPDQIAGLFLLWISGGPIGLATLAAHYCGESAHAAITGGMEKVASLGTWKEPIERNPGNRDRLLAQDPKQFVAKMQAYAQSFYPEEGSPVPGLLPRDFATLAMPVMVLRSGISDIHHPRATSEHVHRLIPGAQIAEPPWGDSEWNDRSAAVARGEGLFQRWPLLAPQILEFARQVKN